MFKKILWMIIITALLFFPLTACDQDQHSTSETSGDLAGNSFSNAHKDEQPTVSNDDIEDVKPKPSQNTTTSVSEPVPQAQPKPASSGNEVLFSKDKTLTGLTKQLNDTADCCLDKYLLEKYSVSNYKKSKEFKFKVCGSAISDCYYSKNEKYFINNRSTVDKQGKFYFGLKQNDHASRLVNSLGWCESNYSPNVVSSDGGYGIFQITPSAIGDKNIKQSMLLQTDYNTQYGIYHLHGIQQNTTSKYNKYSNNNDDFIWYLTLRGYNGGFKYIDRIFDRSEDPLKQVFTGDFIEASKISGRFVCFERVNLVYPLKIYKTSDTLLKKSF